MMGNDLVNNKRRIFTGVWELASVEKRKPIIDLFGNEDIARTFHKTYFQWYNLIHELGHIFRRYHGIKVDWTKEGANEEQAVNDFAMAYWKKFGQNDKLEFIIKYIEQMLKVMPSPIQEEVDFLAYWNEHFSALQSSEIYAFFQFTSVKRSYESNESFSEVLNRFGIKSIDAYDKKLVYDDEYHPQNIIDDCCKILNAMKIDTPLVEVVLLDDILIQRAE